jgi:hypothetical protein
VKFLDEVLHEEEVIMDASLFNEDVMASRNDVIEDGCKSVSQSFKKIFERL